MITRIQLYHFRRLLAAIPVYVLLAGAMTPTMIKTTLKNSKDENSENVATTPEVQRLILEREKRKEVADSWDKWNMGCVFLAGVAAVGLMICAVGVHHSNASLSVVSDALNFEKEKDLSLDLSNKAKEIAGANKVASEAKERAAAFELETVRLQKELSVQDSRGNLFVGEGRQKLVDALTPFAGQHIDIRRSAFAIMVNGAVVTTAPRGDDTIALSNALFSVFKDAKWIQPPRPLLSNLEGYGLEVNVLTGASPKTIETAKALVEALKGLSLRDVAGPVYGTDGREQRVGTEVISPAVGPDTIILHVLTHP